MIGNILQIETLTALILKQFLNISNTFFIY